MSVVVLDDFLPTETCSALRHHALAAHYEPWYGPEGTEAVKRACRVTTPLLTDAIAEAVGEEIAIVHSGFRLDYEDELPHTLVHYDADCGDMAMVLYLNTPAQCRGRGGTAFWEHKATGLIQVPENMDEYVEAGLRTQGQFLDYWESHTIVDMRWNRAILYPTRYFHSRWPLTGWGNSPETGRLVCGAFFNLLG